MNNVRPEKLMLSNKKTQSNIDFFDKESLIKRYHILV